MFFNLVSVAPLTCSSPPGQAVVLRACDGVRGATAAPWPASGAQLTGHAWPAAGELRTWAVADLLVGPVGMEYLEETQTKDLIRRSGRARTDKTGCDIIVNESRYWPRAYRRLGGAASRVREAAGPGEGWGWRRAGKGSGPGEVQLPGDLLPVDGPRNLEDTQDIHHHLLGVRVLGSGYTHFKIVHHRQCMLQSLVIHSFILCYSSQG